MKTLRWLVPCVLVLGLVGGIVGAKVLSVNAAKDAVQAGPVKAGHGCPPGYKGCAQGDPCPDCQAKHAKEAAGTEPAISPEECEKAHAEGTGCPLEGKDSCGGCPLAAKDKDASGYSEGGCPSHKTGKKAEQGA